MNTCVDTTSMDEQLPIYGDVLEAILSDVPLIHLVPASRVSKSWNDAVSSVIHTSTNTKPWLILHTRSSRYPYPTSTHAYDPNSNMWIQIRRSTIDYLSTLRSSQSNLIYMLSNSKLSFSFDPLLLTWHHVVAPKESRIDPIAAVVGNHVVIAGGACDFEDDLLTVEVFDLRLQNWTKSNPMPEFFIGSGSSIWLSIASNDRNMFVMEKCSGVKHFFNPINITCSVPYDLHPNERVFTLLSTSRTTN